MTTARHFRGQQWVPGVSKNPVHSFSTRAQEMQQHQNNRRIANHKRYFERKNRLVNRCYRSEEELRARRIWTRYIRVVQRARFGRMQRVERRVDGNEDIGAIAEPLHAAIPKISVNVIIRTRRHPEKQNMPHRRQHEPHDDYALREYLRREELTNSKKVRDASNGQRNDEGRCTQAAELARADRKRHEHDSAESVQPMRG